MGETENRFQLVSPYKPSGDQPTAIKNLVKSFQEGKKKQTLLGVTGSGKTFTMANVIQALGYPTLVLAHNKTLAAQLFSEFREFFPHNRVEYFVSYYDYYRPEAYVPSSDTYIEKDSSINDEIDKLRHSTTRSLVERNDVIVVASVSCIYGIGSPDDYKENTIDLEIGQHRDRDELLKEMVLLQFTRQDMDIQRSGFRVRGDCVDIFPAHESHEMIRLTFFGDLLERIDMVDALTNQWKRTLKKITIFPSNHYVVGGKRLKNAMNTIRDELRERLQELEKQNKLLEKQRLEQRTLYDLELLEEVGFCSGVENYSRHLTGGTPGYPPPTLLDFYQKNFLIIIDESHMTLPQVGGMYQGDRSRKQTLVDFGFRLPSALDNRPLKFEEFEKKLDRILYVSATPADYEKKQCDGEIVEQVIRPTGLLDPEIEVRSAQDQVENLRQEMKGVIEKKNRILITTLTKKLAEEVGQYYRSCGIKICYLHSEISTLERLEIIQQLRAGVFDVLVGINLLREGLDIPEVSLVAIFDADKEGFLRSSSALIQTIGRAARNEEGRVILYGYKVTPAMQYAIDETARRRKIQMEHNIQYGLTPKTIHKKIYGGVMDYLKETRERDTNKTSQKKKRNEQLELFSKKNRKNDHDWIDKTQKESLQFIEELTLKMKKHAQKYEFEEAAMIRDQIQDIKKRLLI